MAADVLVELGTGMAIIGVMIARADGRIDKVDAKYESRFGEVDSKFDVMARDLVDVKVRLPGSRATCRLVTVLHLARGTGPLPGRTSISLQPATARTDSPPVWHHVLSRVRTVPRGRWRR